MNCNEASSTVITRLFDILENSKNDKVYSVLKKSTLSFSIEEPNLYVLYYMPKHNYDDEYINNYLTKKLVDMNINNYIKVRYFTEYYNVKDLSYIECAYSHKWVNEICIFVNPAVFTNSVVHFDPRTI